MSKNKNGSLSEWVSDKITYWAVRWQLKNAKQQNVLKRRLHTFQRKQLSWWLNLDLSIICIKLITLSIICKLLFLGWFVQYPLFNFFSSESYLALLSVFMHVKSTQPAALHLWKQSSSLSCRKSAAIHIFKASIVLNSNSDTNIIQTEP